MKKTPLFLLLVAFVSVFFLLNVGGVSANSIYTVQNATQTTYSDGGTATFNLNALPNAIGDGNTLVMAFGSNEWGYPMQYVYVVSVVQSGVTWAQASQTEYYDGASEHLDSEIWIGSVSASASSTITVTIAEIGYGYGVVIDVAEYSGLSSPVVVAKSNNNMTGDFSNPSVELNATTPAADNLVVAECMISSGTTQTDPQNGFYLSDGVGVFGGVSLAYLDTAQSVASTYPTGTTPTSPRYWVATEVAIGNGAPSYTEVANASVRIFAGVSITSIANATVTIITGALNYIANATVTIISGAINYISNAVVTIISGASNIISSIWTSIIVEIQTNNPPSGLAIPINFIIFLLMLIIPTMILWSYVGSIAVAPTVILMTIISFMAGLIPIAFVILVVIVAIGILFRRHIPVINRGGTE